MGPVVPESFRPWYLPNVPSNPVILNFKQIIESIRERRNARRPTPALILLYTGIDIAGWLAAEDPSEGVAKRFTAWVDRYMLPAPGIECSALDLYGARCGLLHSMSPSSNLSDGDKVVLLCYAWGDSRATDLKALILTGGMANRVAVQGEALIEAFEAGLYKFFDEVQSDAQLQARVVERGERVFGELSSDSVRKLHEWGKRMLGEG